MSGERESGGRAWLDIALVHYPVRNRRGETIGSAVTNLDLHDIARTGRTYGVRRYYVVTPYDDQIGLAGEIIAHWRQGKGGEHNPDRKEAFSIVRLVRDMDEMLAMAVDGGTGRSPLLLATSAIRRAHGTMGFDEARRYLEEGRPAIILFGTASGLDTAVFQRCHACLPPVGSGGAYNHLPVRAAAAIILDRLLGV